MRRLLLLLLVTAVVALPCLADLDFSVRMEGVERQARLATSMTFHVGWEGDEPALDAVLELDIPAFAVRVQPWDEQIKCTAGRPVRCTLPMIERFAGGLYANVQFPQRGTYVVTARITGTNRDPRPENNVATLTTTVEGVPSLRPFASVRYAEPHAVDPGGAGTLSIGVTNDGETAANVTLTARLPEGGIFTALSDPMSRFCRHVSETEVQCRLGDVGQTAVRTFVIPFLAPDRAEGGPLPFLVVADADQEDYDPADDTHRVEAVMRRLFAVTHGGDDGAGSLRQAILASRDVCEDAPCLIAVRAPEPLIIEPHVPLPKLRGRVKVDGGAGRSIVDGSRIHAMSDGLHFENGCELRVTRLFIRNFSGHAIEAHQASTEPFPCRQAGLLTPVHISDNELAGNLRGVVTKSISATISRNVIRDHVRAGIFVDRAYYSDIHRNVIVNNGASGIFVNAARNPAFYLPPGADIVENIVTGNGEWGITRTPTGAVQIGPNIVFANRARALDNGLDGRTVDPQHRVFVDSATYDAGREVTIIRGRYEIAGGGFGRVDVYASASLGLDGAPEAEQWLGWKAPVGNFTLEVSGDLRGKWIAATGTRQTHLLFARDGAASNAESRWDVYDTTELSDPVPVQ